MLEDKLIRDFSQNDYTYQEFRTMVKYYSKEGYDVFIGSDSQVHRRNINIVTAICFLKQGDNQATGKIFYVKNKEKRKEYPNLRTRMLLEAYRSIEAAMEIEELVVTKLTIHLDVGETIKSKSASYHKELQALVKGQGYDCQIKPNSWASSAVADKVVR